MDPNACLTEILRLAKKLVDDDSQYPDQYPFRNADQLAELVLALDQWIRKGGAIPDQWLAARIQVMPPPIQEPLCGDTHWISVSPLLGGQACQCILNQGHEGPHCLEVE